MIETRGSHGPDFLVIGAQRAGTTWLHLILRRHPKLWLPPVKELHYFDKLCRGGTWRGERWRRAWMAGRACLDPWSLTYLLATPNDAWYAQLFLTAQQRGLIAGEVTPAYATLNQHALRRIRDLNSEIKLAYVMRDPVERAWSAVNNSYRKGHIDGSLTVEKALARARAPAFAARSAYADTIKRLEAIYPSRQLYFCFFDDLRERPKRFASSLLSFLGVESGEVSKLLPPSPVNMAATGTPVPILFECEMAKHFLPQVRELSQRFAGAPQKWQTRYENMLNDEGRMG